MRRSLFIVLAMALPVVSAALPVLPITVPKPPPGTVAGTTECKVGRTHSASAYAHDLGCLLGSVTLASMAPSPPDSDWMIQLSDAAYALASQSTAITRTESAYLYAAKITLKPVLMKTASDSAKGQLCSRAATSVESACLTFYCGSKQLRPATAELNEAKKYLHDSCGTDVLCTAQQHGLDPDKCYDSWTRTQDELARAYASLMRVQTDAAYAASTKVAVQLWAQQAQALASKTEAEIRSNSAPPLANEPQPELLAKAVPALTAMRTDELHAADLQLAQTKQYYETLSCPALDLACSAKRKEGQAAAKLLATNVAAKKLDLQRNASEANSERKLNTLSDEFVFKAPKLSGASTPPSGMAAPGKSGPP
jgi:hypothetical protein